MPGLDDTPSDLRLAAKRLVVCVAKLNEQNINVQRESLVELRAQKRRKGKAATCVVSAQIGSLIAATLSGSRERKVVADNVDIFPVKRCKLL